jgi:alanyl-tRNA synthetase
VNKLDNPVACLKKKKNIDIIISKQTAIVMFYACFVILEFPVIEGRIECMVDDSNKLCKTVSEGATVAVIVNKTQFYAEKGGQVGDKGLIKTQVIYLKVSNVMHL